MSVMYVDLVLAAWLLVSAFALGHTPLSATLNVIVAIAVGVLAWASLKKPSIRFVNSAITLPPRDLSDPSGSKQQADMLARWRAEAEKLAGRPTRSFVLSGDPESEILQHASREGYDLLVLGTHGRTGVAHLLLGSVAEHVARRAPCPVLFVRDHGVMEARDDEEEFALYR